MTTWNHLDGRLKLKPRDYLVSPQRFGADADNRPVVPTGGDLISARVAWTQHQLVLAYRALDDRPSGADLARRYACSRSVISESMNGHRWMGLTIAAAVLAELPGPNSASRVPPIEDANRQRGNT